MSHKGFCLATLETFISEWPGGSYLIMNSNSIVTVDRQIMAIGYKYNSRKVL